MVEQDERRQPLVAMAPSPLCPSALPLLLRVVTVDWLLSSLLLLTCFFFFDGGRGCMARSGRG